MFGSRRGCLLVTAALGFVLVAHPRNVNASTCYVCSGNVCLPSGNDTGGRCTYFAGSCHIYDGMCSEIGIESMPDVVSEAVLFRVSSQTLDGIFRGGQGHRVLRDVGTSIDDIARAISISAVGTELQPELVGYHIVPGTTQGVVGALSSDGAGYAYAFRLSRAALHVKVFEARAGSASRMAASANLRHMEVLLARVSFGGVDYLIAVGAHGAGVTDGGASPAHDEVMNSTVSSARAYPNQRLLDMRFIGALSGASTD